MRLRAQGIDEDNGGVIRVRRARGRGKGIYNVSKGSETTMAAAGARHQERGIYNNNGGVVGGRRSLRL